MLKKEKVYWDIEKTIDVLAEYFRIASTLTTTRLVADIQANFGERIHEEIKAVLSQLVEFPPHHSRHSKLLETHFFANQQYEKSVFLMTKYPVANDANNNGLVNVIETVTQAVQECNFIPLIASQRQYHPILWDNVELHLLGCAKGLAILEDKYRPELNPNVALEVGWMRGMGKTVFVLVEEKFVHRRADWEGFLVSTFKWNEPESTIKPAIKKWLLG
jgi:hypothetical protein